MSGNSRYPEATQQRPAGQVVLALLLLIGLYFPTSTHGEHSTPCVLLAFAVLLGLLGCLLWRIGPHRGAALYIALPLVIVLSACTLRALGGISPQIDPGICVKFAALALLLTLNLRQVRFGRLAEIVFAAANLLNLAFGAAILAGNDWVGEFLPRFYWSFYPELIPNMMRLHKPVLTLGTHASAGFFLYLFFWVNWESHKTRRGKAALWFALGYVILLLGLTSFSSLAFAAVALIQIAVWCWKHNRNMTIAVTACLVIAVSSLADLAADYIDLWQLSQLELGINFLNSDKNGPWARYGSGGGSVPAVSYLFDSPLSPIGLTTPPERAGGSAALGDSGPIEYLLRGSIPLLLVMYVGFYRFLRFNLASPRHALFVFLLVLGFESAFSLLVYVRTLYLLPFFIVCLNAIAEARNDGSAGHALRVAT